jgi:hypothetical protein
LLLVVLVFVGVEERVLSESRRWLTCGCCVAPHVAGRKKRRGRSGDESDESGGGVPVEQNHAQIIQYQPVNSGDFPDSFLRTLVQSMPGEDMPADFEAAFNSMQLGQV